MSKHIIKGKHKILPVMIELELEKLKELNRELCTIKDIEVGYSEDQLQMANETIRKMKSRLKNVNVNLWNMLHPYYKDDGSSGLE